MSSFSVSKREAWIGVAIVAVVGWGVISCLILLIMWLYRHVGFSLI